MLKKVVVFLLLNVSCTLLVYGQQQAISRVAVVDLPRVYSEFVRDSAAVRTLETRTAEVQREIDRMQREIQTLRSNLANAIQRDNQAEILRTETEINRRTENLRQFHQISTAELEAQRRNLTPSGTFLNDVQDEIRRIAERGGFTHVLDRNNTPGLLWFNSSFDITEELIRGLRERGRS